MKKDMRVDLKQNQVHRLESIYKTVELVLDSCRHDSTKSPRACIFSVLDTHSINRLCEALSNLLNHSELLSNGVRRRIKRGLKKGQNKQKCLELIDKSKPVNKRRKILMKENQSGGGFILPLLSAVIPLIGSLLGR